MLCGDMIWLRDGIVGEMDAALEAANYPGAAVGARDCTQCGGSRFTEMLDFGAGFGIW